VTSPPGVPGLPGVTLTWDLLADIRGLFAYPFMVTALQAGTTVAVLGGIVGWFMVLRRESFAGHTLAVVGFAGGSAAAFARVDPAIGFFTAGVLAALVIARLPASRAGGLGGFGEQSAGIGTVQAVALAAGYLFSSLYGGLLSGASSLLFGSIGGVSTAQVQLLVIVAAGCLLALAAIGRPLLFVSVDPVLAAARRVPVTLVATVFLVILALAATATAQVTGSLLVFSLLVAPAATAHRLTVRPARGMAVSVVLGLLVVWLGIASAYYLGYPIGFWVSSYGFGAYLLTVLVQQVGRSVRGRARLSPQADPVSQ